MGDERTSDDHLNPAEYPFCPHGVRLGTPMRMDLWNGPVARCVCCFSMFGYIDHGSWSSDGVSHGRYWYPKNKCGSCGGSYHTGALTSNQRIEESGNG
jgi:hypothetical protein